MRYNNLYFNLGCHDYQVESYVRNAELIRDEIVKDLGLSEKELSVVPSIRPERFHI